MKAWYYVERQKNDATDAEAICEAVTKPNMRFVPTKTVEQQSCLILHRARYLFIRQQTAVINSIRSYLAEIGIVAPVGRRGVEQLLEVVANRPVRRLVRRAAFPKPRFDTTDSEADLQTYGQLSPISKKYNSRGFGKKLVSLIEPRPSRSVIAMQFRSRRDRAFDRP